MKRGKDERDKDKEEERERQREDEGERLRESIEVQKKTFEFFTAHHLSKYHKCYDSAGNGAKLNLWRIKTVSGNLKSANLEPYNELMKNKVHFISC